MTKKNIRQTECQGRPWQKESGSAWLFKIGFFKIDWKQLIVVIIRFILSKNVRFRYIIYVIMVLIIQ